MLQKVIDHEKTIIKLKEGDIFTFMSDTRENKKRVDNLITDIH
jgi:hypothetical protein